MSGIGNKKAINPFGLNKKYYISLLSLWVLAYLYPLVIKMAKEGQHSFKLCACVETKPLFVGLTLLHTYCIICISALWPSISWSPIVPFSSELWLFPNQFSCFSVVLGHLTKIIPRDRWIKNGKEGIHLATNTLKSLLLGSGTDESLNSSNIFLLL